MLHVKCFYSTGVCFNFNCVTWYCNLYAKLILKSSRGFSDSPVFLLRYFVCFSSSLESHLLLFVFNQAGFHTLMVAHLLGRKEFIYFLLLLMSSFLFLISFRGYFMPHRATSDNWRLEMHLSSAFPNCIGFAQYRWEYLCNVLLLMFFLTRQCITLALPCKYVHFKYSPYDNIQLF